MIRLVNKKLIIPRGDTGSFSLPALTSLSEGDKAIFSIIDTRTNKILFPKECAYENDTLTIEFTHYDTVNLPVGKYYWDIKIYQGAEIVDNQIVNGIEVDSYDAAYHLPVCEIRQTGDLYLTDTNNEIVNNNTINIVSTALNQVNTLNALLETNLNKIIQTANSSTPYFTLSDTQQRLILQGKYQLIDANGTVIDTTTTGINTTNTGMVIGYIQDVHIIPTYTKPSLS